MSKTNITGTYVSTDIRDLIAIDKTYIKELSTENSILEIIVNGFMMSDKVPQDLKDEIIKCVGKRWFHINDENKEIFWTRTK